MDGQYYYIFCLSREDNIKMDHKETARQGGDWIYLSENTDMCPALMNAVKNHQIPRNV